MRGFQRRWNSKRFEKLDPGPLIGLGVAGVFLFGGVLVGAGDILRFFDLSGLFIVCGGTLGATMVQCPLEDIREAWEASKQAFFRKQCRVIERIRYLVNLSQAVRTQGRIQVLEREAENTPDPFLKFALDMTLDGHPSPEIKRVLETELKVAEERASRAVNVLDTLGGYAPALGLIGTVIGLIQMLSDLRNPATVGPAMATAFTTTLYGALLANTIFLPLAGKLRTRMKQDTLVKSSTIEGIIAVNAEENPIVVEQKLHSYLSAVGS